MGPAYNDLKMQINGSNELLNIVVNDFDVKKSACISRDLVVTELFLKTLDINTLVTKTLDGNPCANRHDKQWSPNSSIPCSVDGTRSNVSATFAASRSAYRFPYSGVTNENLCLNLGIL